MKGANQKTRKGRAEGNGSPQPVNMNEWGACRAVARARAPASPCSPGRRPRPSHACVPLRDEKYGKASRLFNLLGWCAEYLIFDLFLYMILLLLPSSPPAGGRGSRCVLATPTFETLALIGA